ncbi:uncharacterized protein PGTG_11074 [Puccinia graminis f. sp. tritici CRL 75-36-700-3]|uniref:SigF-like NTF2-like domain-containing protein n=1 Tax=Puccinia graminis f. sp. tritici (strain CRL 75-36-700-3 / race SCCL) TaxID=418459 RepID=E3KNA9_PUCGT|nr:uncharacterized protein PGTG_11074 [Puccinia graminis f. sp. tritici CRL 75-36-700-3]EFP85745.2 hypothetical protein PGTG_11074 [Puccinia graminis f. sp. tritici CRL 75-36-700-3]
MEDPVKELPEVVRKITEPYAATEIVHNVDKYFTDDAYLLYPMINQPHTKNGKSSLKGIYKLLLSGSDAGSSSSFCNHWCANRNKKLIEYLNNLSCSSSRVLTINNQIEFHAVMFSEDKLKATIELSETLQGRFIPVWFKLRFLSRVDLRQEADGKYRICKQEDNYPNDLKRAGLEIIPGLATALAVLKLVLALVSALVGNFYLDRGLFGP